MKIKDAEMVPEKEFRVEIRLRNNLIQRRREKLGLTRRQAAQASGVDYHMWCALESMGRCPFSTKVGWIVAARKMSDFFRCLPDDLWPDSVLAVRKTTGEFEAGSAELRGLLGSQVGGHLLGAGTTNPEESAGISELQAVVKRSLLRLTPREAHVVRKVVLEGETYDAVGVELNCGKERIRQINEKALNKIRGCSDITGLIDFNEEP